MCDGTAELAVVRVATGCKRMSMGVYGLLWTHVMSAVGSRVLGEGVWVLVLGEISTFSTMRLKSIIFQSVCQAGMVVDGATGIKIVTDGLKEEKTAVFNKKSYVESVFVLFYIPRNSMGSNMAKRGREPLSGSWDILVSLWVPRVVLVVAGVFV